MFSVLPCAARYQKCFRSSSNDDQICCTIGKCFSRNLSPDWALLTGGGEGQGHLMLCLVKHQDKARGWPYFTPQMQRNLFTLCRLFAHSHEIQSTSLKKTNLFLVYRLSVFVSFLLFLDFVPCLYILGAFDNTSTLVLLCECKKMGIIDCRASEVTAVLESSVKKPCQHLCQYFQQASLTMVVV